MDEFLKQDIFFFITALAVVLVTIMLVVLLFYIIRITKNVDHVLGKVREETDIITEELAELRRNIKKQGARIKDFLQFFVNLKKRR